MRLLNLVLRSQHSRTSSARGRSRRRHAALAGALAALVLGVIAVATLCAPPTTYADGGAPNLAYVAGAGSGGGDLAVIDVGQRRVTGSVHLGGDPEGVVLSADGGSAYVTQAAADRLAIVDTHEQRVVASIPIPGGPSALAAGLIQSGSELYVAEREGNAVAVVDTAARRVVATIPVGRRPVGVALAGPDSGIGDPSDRELYVANEDSATVSVISAVRRRVVATIAVPGGPMGVVVPATGGIAYVGTRAGDVVALGVADHRLLGTVLHLAVGTPGTMDYDASTGQIYVPVAAAGVVEVLAPVAPEEAGTTPHVPAEPARTLRLGGGPAAVAITFDGVYGFAAQRDAGRVAMLDVGSHQVLRTIPVGGAPRAIVTGPYPPAVNGLTAFVVDMAVVGLVLVMLGVGLLSGRRRRSKSRQRASRGGTG